MDIDKNHVAYDLIRGGTPRYGEIPLSGAKNAITKMIIASLLTAEPCLLRNVPLIGDFDLALALCREMGSKIRLQDHTLSIATPSIRRSVVSTEVGGLNRMAIITVGPLLHRCGEADIHKPGGDCIGARPIDFHLSGLRQMGAEVVEGGKSYHFSDPNGIKGDNI